MNFYKYILMAFIFDNLYLRVETNLIVKKGFNISPCSIGFEFWVTLRSVGDCEVDVRGDQCCLVDGDGENCDVLKIVGGCNDYILGENPKTLVLIAPILNPYQRKGYCSIYVDSKSSNEHTNKRDVVIIDFDTRIRDKDTNNSNLKACKGVDEDPLNDCKPVDCDSYYNTNKPFYHPKYKRCVEIPKCVSNSDIIYNPLSNACIEESITDDDIELLKEQDNKVRKSKDILIIRNKFNDTDILDLNNDDLNNDDFQVKPNHKNKITSPRNVTPKTDEIYFKMLIKKCFVGDNMPLVILLFIITIQCCLIFALVYCMTRTCNCFKEKKVVRKFFNYRQDATVTTPLINTSNMDTETDYQFQSDSSKVDQKIKCYKACQKEISTVRPTMSDDILSKCINRRDWKHTRSEAIPELIESENFKRETKVMFEDEKLERLAQKDETFETNAQTSTEKRETSEKAVEVNRSSELEIKCHSYTTNAPGFNQRSVSTRFITEQPRRSVSLSTEKGAQACFSNDSIDEYLSERGMIYLAGEDVSKYTFSSNSTENKPSVTSISSKTSKNIVQKVLSLIHKKSKAPLSDPGSKKALDLELLHMSKATVYSSSNDSDYKAYRKKKDSRTSL